MSDDMKSVIIPKSDQLNSDDLITGPITVRVAAVTIRGGQEQPISVSYEGDNGKPYKPCKSMCRVMVTAWGADSKRYVGRSMTLYRDPKVKWAGMDVGGIRISHMSDIDENMTMALTATKGSRKPYTVKPLSKDSSTQIPASSASNGAATPPVDRSAAGTVPDDDKIIADVDAWIAKRKFKAAGDIASLIVDEQKKADTLAKIEAAYKEATTK